MCFSVCFRFVNASHSICERVQYMLAVFRRVWKTWSRSTCKRMISTFGVFFFFFENYLFGLRVISAWLSYFISIFISSHLIILKKRNVLFKQAIYYDIFFYKPSKSFLIAKKITSKTKINLLVPVRIWFVMWTITHPSCQANSVTVIRKQIREIEFNF